MSTGEVSLIPHHKLPFSLVSSYLCLSTEVRIRLPWKEGLEERVWPERSGIPTERTPSLSFAGVILVSCKFLIMNYTCCFFYSHCFQISIKMQTHENKLFLRAICRFLHGNYLSLNSLKKWKPHAKTDGQTDPVLPCNSRRQSSRLKD